MIPVVLVAAALVPVAAQALGRAKERNHDRDEWTRIKSMSPGVSRGTPGQSCGLTNIVLLNT